MGGVCCTPKKCLNCRSSESVKVNDPNNVKMREDFYAFGCSRSLSNLRCIMINIKKPKVCSSRSIKHEAVVIDTSYELKINHNTFSLVTKGFETNSNFKRWSMGVCPKQTGRSIDVIFQGFAPLVCEKCGEKSRGLEAFEEHHFSKHAVTELDEGDSSRKIVEMIYNKSNSRSSNAVYSNYGGIEKVFKVHHLETTIARFENYREIVKIKATRQSKKHPRCLADGNEMLRFCGTTVSCPLESSSLCTSQECGVCRILRHGFSPEKRTIKNRIGVLTASTSTCALESIGLDRRSASVKRALMVCRGIAGPVQEVESRSGFDSLAGKSYWCVKDSEEVYILSPNALLPCFVVIFKS